MLRSRTCGFARQILLGKYRICPQETGVIPALPVRAGVPRAVRDLNTIGQISNLFCLRWVGATRHNGTVEYVSLDIHTIDNHTRRTGVPRLERGSNHDPAHFGLTIWQCGSAPTARGSV